MKPLRPALSTIPGVFAVCRLDPASPVPRWAMSNGFLAIVRTAEELSIVCAEQAVPADVTGDPSIAFSLHGAMPNPSRTGAFAVSFTVPSGAAARLMVFDLAGRLVRTLAGDTQSAGRYVVAWNGRDDRGATLRSGMYFIQVRIGDQAKRVRVTYLK